MFKNLPLLNFPNDGEDLILETDSNNETGVQYSKSKKQKKLCTYCSGSFNKLKCNYPTIKK